MSQLVRALRSAGAATLAALTVSSGVLVMGLPGGAAVAQGAPAHLGAPPVVVAQRAQRPPAQTSSRIKENAGRYAVLREEDKDTLCMVTLFETARGRGYYRAQLAPACRDNGVVVFDPQAWSIDNKGRLSLQAHKGHKMILNQDKDGVWRRTDAPKARPLSLRRI